MDYSRATSSPSKENALKFAFVQFLLSSNQITEAAADQITRWALPYREPIGRIAFEHGLIEARHIDEILSRQCHSDQKFGEIGVEMGLLTGEQVDILLGIQTYRVSASIAEALALMGLLPLRTSIGLLSDFVKQQPEQFFSTPAARATV